MDVEVKQVSAHWFTSAVSVATGSVHLSPDLVTYGRITAFVLRLIGCLFGVKIESIRDGQGQVFYVDRKTFENYLKKNRELQDAPSKESCQKMLERFFLSNDRNRRKDSVESSTSFPDVPSSSSVESFEIEQVFPEMASEFKNELSADAEKERSPTESSQSDLGDEIFVENEDQNLES